VGITKLNRELISSGNPMEAMVGLSHAVRVGPLISAGGTAPVDAEGCGCEWLAMEMVLVMRVGAQ